MSSLDVERRLTEVLHRHAEDAMSRTDTQKELREFLLRGDPEPPRARRDHRLANALGAGLAAAAVAAAVVWGDGLTEDRTEPMPVAEPVPPAVQVAEAFVAAYAANDTETVASLASDDAAVDDWRIHMARNQVWSAQFLFDPCREMTTNSVGTGVLCPFALHVLGSEEIGRGPFENASFTLWVNAAGEVFEADPTWNFENNGMAEHVDEVTGWVLARHPDQAEFLGLDELEVPAGQYDRYLSLWERYFQDYADAHP